MRHLRRLAAAAVALVFAGGVYAMSRSGDGYEVALVLPAAGGLVTGTPVQIAGSDAGTITDVTTRDGKAVVRVEMAERYTPLHDGTAARIAWKAVLGERLLEITPGPEQNPALPDGALVPGTIAPVEFDTVLAALDPDTRERLTSLLSETTGTLDGREPDLNRTIQTAGPALDSLGHVLQAVGQDGPAIQSLVTRLRELTGVLAARHGDVSGTVEHLSRFTEVTAARQEALRAALRELPSTLSTARQTLDRVPAAADAATPLLTDLGSATERLPAVARNLEPLLADLRPAVADLRPTLAAAETLLGRTPALLDSAHATLPPLTAAAVSGAPALEFLRPYTPEIAGWMANWGSATANYDSHGHYHRFLVQGGMQSANVNPGVMPPGVRQNLTPAPGTSEGQPWTDATGSGMR
ncbi:MlaD family protein [Pseudonocardia sp. H11422]|uniref:MlaD family protein n=1 Tax=Pseudonocardia sp. H11422 TaxID=2835866 RepID=UPI001BDCB5AA|nr:MlaD family protein [Pseudonocardia sp. H11422]